MATNRLPVHRDSLFALAATMAEGLHADESRLGVKQNTEASLRADLSAAIDARDTYNMEVTCRAALVESLETAEANARTLIINARNVLTHHIGKPWSDAWAATGFSRKSAQVPPKAPQRLALLSSLGAYFQANPDKQGASLNVTGAIAVEVFKALQDAFAAISRSDSAVAAAKSARDRTDKALRWRVSGLVGELRQLIDDDDPAWYRFGLNRPDDLEAPAIPEGVVVTGGLPGTIHIGWAPARRAERYRVFKKEEVDSDYVPIATTTDPFATISDLKGSGTVHIQIRAANASGESQPSVPAQIVVPAEPTMPAQV